MKKTKVNYAGKFFRLKYELMTNDQKLIYERELKILQKISHPLVIKY
jgi:hypothetical protein